MSGPADRANDTAHGNTDTFVVGGSIGAGLFVGSGSALSTGGPASLVIGFLLTGLMLLCTMQALGELAVLYPVNGAFFMYATRFIDRSWGFAMGWQYAIGWLTVLPFELTAASITIDFWNDRIHPSIFVTAFLVFLIGVQFFSVRGYGEVEFVLSSIKVAAICGFIIFAIVVNAGGVPTDHRGYIGFRYWADPGAFANGFKGFCSVFSTAAFAFGGTELTGLAAAEAVDPHKSLPRAVKGVFWRITFCYIVTLFLLGTILPYDNPQLLGASGANTKASPFVLAIQEAGVQGLPSVFNGVITISVISVANSCTFGSTRTLQALAAEGMAPKFLAYVDQQGRPLNCIILQMLVGCIAYIGEADVSTVIFNWLLSVTALSFVFTWLSINLSHIRFRAGWKHAGYNVDQLPYQAAFGVLGSWIGVTLNVVALMVTLYKALFPLHGSPNASVFFQSYLAGPAILLLYGGWKLQHRDWSILVRRENMDVKTGLREDLMDLVVDRPQLRGWRRWKEALF